MEGVDLRHKGDRATTRAKPHASAAAHQEEAYEKVWEDAMEGRVLLCFGGTPGFECIVSSPRGRVDKTNPDRTVPDGGKIVTDMRAPNKGCAKEEHPLVHLPDEPEMGEEPWETEEGYWDERGGWHWWPEPARPSQVRTF